MSTVSSISKVIFFFVFFGLYGFIDRADEDFDRNQGERERGSDTQQRGMAGNQNLSLLKKDVLHLEKDVSDLLVLWRRKKALQPLCGRSPHLCPPALCRYCLLCYHQHDFQFEWSLYIPPFSLWKAEESWLGDNN